MRKEHFYKTAFLPGPNIHCSVIAFDEITGFYRVNFGFDDVWIDGKELTRFCL